MRKPALLILAAGMGSRYGGLKQIDGVGPQGETIMDYSVYDAIRAGFGKIIFVIRGSFREEFEKRITERYGKTVESLFVEQELDKIPSGFKLNEERVKPWGTGHAVLMAAKEIETSFAVINADDYYGYRSFSLLSDFLQKRENCRGEYCMVGFNLKNTLSESGSVSRGICSIDSNQLLTRVEEHHNIKAVENHIEGENSIGVKVTIDGRSPVSMNMWGFTPDIFEEGERLFKDFLCSNSDNLKAEFYIPFVVNSIIEKKVATCKLLSTPDEWFGVTYKEDRETVMDKLKKMTARGVYPSPLF